MTGPRLSIIPAGAVFDRTLEPRDLQVLCLLGIHTDRLGWCFKSQVAMARELECGRSSIQRSLDRLYAADWVEKRLRSRGGAPINPERPHAAHAYRVKLDRQDIRFDLLDDGTGLEDDASGEKGCPPVGTSPGGCPPRAGTGCPRMHGHMNDDSNVSSSSSSIADEIAEMVGVDDAKDAAWFDVGPTLIVQRWLASGYTREHLIEGVRRGMIAMRKRNGKPRDIRYFQTIWQRVRAEAETPVPVPNTNNGDQNGTTQNGFIDPLAPRKDRSRRTFKEQRWADAWDNVNERLGLARSDDDRSGEQIGTQTARRLSKPGSA